MCSASLNLLIGALLVLAVENEATTMITSTEINTAVSVSTGNTTILNETSVNILNNLTTSFPPNSTVMLSSTTDANMSDYKSDFPTPHPSEDPQTNNDTTDDPIENVPQSSTKEIKSTTSKTTITRAQEPVKSHGATYIIILIIVVVCISGVVVYCCLQKKSRKYSVDLHPKQEDAQIPLSTVDVEVFDTTSVKESVDVKQENQQNLSSTQAKVIPKDKTEEMTVVDISDVEPTISTKTSMESLDDALNENNSNNTRAKDI
ncbi:uncharacterized protein LOC143753930 isoform X2 [Siphateles boraxobius]|uniref:uncharacterized protein LOC143753930 isoform X2 n=1 Tax=Siphateles boraxobius TaxID=180520 RepID=UPI004063C9F7